MSTSWEENFGRALDEAIRAELATLDDEEGGEHDACSPPDMFPPEGGIEGQGLDALVSCRPVLSARISPCRIRLEA